MKKKIIDFSASSQMVEYVEQVPLYISFPENIKVKNYQVIREGNKVKIEFDYEKENNQAK